MELHINNFFNFKNKELKIIHNKYLQLKKNPNKQLVNLYIKNYPWLNRKKTNNIPYFYELLQIETIRKNFPDKYITHTHTHTHTHRHTHTLKRQHAIHGHWCLCQMCKRACVTPCVCVCVRVWPTTRLEKRPGS